MSSAIRFNLDQSQILLSGEGLFDLVNLSNFVSPCYCSKTVITLTTQCQLFINIDVEENIVGKGENAGNQYFLLFLQCVLPFHKQILDFEGRFILSFTNAFNFHKSTTLWYGKELKSQ